MSDAEGSGIPGGAMGAIPFVVVFLVRSGACRLPTSSPTRTGFPKSERHASSADFVTKRPRIGSRPGTMRLTSPNPGRWPGVAVKEGCTGIWTCSIWRLPDAALVQFSGRTAQRTFRPCCCNLLYRGYGSDHATWARPLPVERNALGNDCQSVHCPASK